MKKQFLLQRVLYACCICVLLTYCRKQDNVPESKDVSHTSTELTTSRLEGMSEEEVNNIWDEEVHNVGAITAKLLKGVEFRSYLKEKVIESFDGDYDVLLSTVVNDITDRQGSSNPLVTEVNYISSEQINYLQSASEDFPQMQLSVQVDPEIWNTSTYTPVMVYTTFDYDEKTTAEVPVVDHTGNIAGHLDAKEDPENPVVIVSLNERTFINQQGSVELFELPYPEGVDGPEDVDSLPPIDPTVPVQWYRQNFKYETIYSFGFWDIGDIEGWPGGGPELRTFHYSASDTIGISYAREGYYVGQRKAKRKWVKNKWYNLPTEKLITTHLWRWGQTGTVCKFAFYEFDSEPFRKEHADSLAALLTRFARVNSSGTVVTPVEFAAATVRLIGLFLPKEGKLSETIGELEVSVNNNATEFHLATGGFGFRSKPY